ncbi:putative nucleocapsid [Kadiweu virus]|uniref:Nucleocapsid n=1 Tax=Kadiweu virus TaxID=1795438 RepID=A0A1B1X3Z7_9NIDO|nr:putative nucleocapsid [Kadiweu virus]ANW72260.1 putative nucleocapsid [Kadiweu virus]
MSANASNNTASTSTTKPKQQRQNQNQVQQNNTPKPQRQSKNQQNQQKAPLRAQNQNAAPRKNNQRKATNAGSQPKAPAGKPKKPIAVGPNYTDTNGKRYKIGREFDARNHMGWRRNEKTGSTVQFLFKPKMASRVDQAYYRSQFEDSDHYIHTFGVGVFVQDSNMDRNAVLRPQDLSEKEKQDYLENLANAFDKILVRTKFAFENNSQPLLVIDA